MSIVLHGNLAVTVPNTTGGRAAVAAFIKAVKAADGTVTGGAQPISTEFTGLGFSDKLNAGLVSRGIWTVDHLASYTEDQLLGLTGVVSYGNLATIIRVLAQQTPPRVLRDCTVDPADLIELLTDPQLLSHRGPVMTHYERLKRHGIDSISELRALAAQPGSLNTVTLAAISRFNYILRLFDARARR